MVIRENETLEIERIGNYSRMHMSEDQRAKLN